MIRFENPAVGREDFEDLLFNRSTVRADHESVHFFPHRRSRGRYHFGFRTLNINVDEIDDRILRDEGRYRIGFHACRVRADDPLEERIPREKGRAVVARRVVQIREFGDSVFGRGRPVLVRVRFGIEFISAKSRPIRWPRRGSSPEMGSLRPGRRSLSTRRGIPLGFWCSRNR